MSHAMILPGPQNRLFSSPLCHEVSRKLIQVDGNKAKMANWSWPRAGSDVGVPRRRLSFLAHFPLWRLAGSEGPELW